MTEKRDGLGKKDYSPKKVSEEMNTYQVVERASQANASSRQSLTLFVEQMLDKGPLCVRHSTET